MDIELSVPVRSHIPCEKCGSSDAATEYSDGHTYCFSCRATWGGGQVSSQPAKPPGPIISEGDYQDIPDRAVSGKTCRHYGYKVIKTKRGLLHVAPFRGGDGAVVAQEIRRTWLAKADPWALHLAW